MQNLYVSLESTDDASNLQTLTHERHHLQTQRFYYMIYLSRARSLPYSLHCSKRLLEGGEKTKKQAFNSDEHVKMVLVNVNDTFQLLPLMSFMKSECGPE